MIRKNWSSYKKFNKNIMFWCVHDTIIRVKRLTLSVRNCMWNRESIDTCGEKCWATALKKRERDKHNSHLLSIATRVGCFEDPTVETLSNRAVIFIEDSSLIFLQSGPWDCLLEVYKSIKNFVKSCRPYKFPLTISLSCFKNPTVKSSPIALKFLLEFYHS